MILARWRSLPNPVRVLFQGIFVGTVFWTSLGAGAHVLAGSDRRFKLVEALGLALLGGLAGGAMGAAVDARGGALEDRSRARIRSSPVLYAEAGAREVVRVALGTRTSWSRTDLVVTDQLLASFAYRSFLGVRVRLGPTVIVLRGAEGQGDDRQAETWQPTAEGVTVVVRGRGLAPGQTLTIRSRSPSLLQDAMGRPEA